MTTIKDIVMNKDYVKYIDDEEVRNLLSKDNILIDAETNRYHGVDWSRLEDPMDRPVFDQLVEQFWTSTRIPVSNDLSNWRKATQDQRNVIDKSLAGLTTLDSLQSREGGIAQMAGAITPHELDVYNNMKFMETIHAQSYSTVFTTLNSSKRIEELFNWSYTNDHLQKQIDLINETYALECPIRSKVGSVFLESFLFFSGFYSALRLANIFPNVAEVIRLIMRDEAMHGAYVGYKFKVLYEMLPKEEQDEIKEWTYELLFELYTHEVKYTEEIYDSIGWTEDVKRFVEYNANKALSNMGLDPVFTTTVDDVNPTVMQRLDTGAANHDFFSMAGNGYIVGKVEANTEDDYAFMLDSLILDNLVEENRYNEKDNSTVLPLDESSDYIKE